ncbi:IEC3 subunit of the Ino80 complex, chromatin re-modelling-domain-containing protein [Hypoxylon sp. FL1150]|nr:IEC3 subunit of the Ino80 complex, chromatin re-modelling-domain-containing protein [Hypoxylon sp. FL1150]
MDRTSVKAELDKDNDHGGLQMADARPSYKSWKKKYRKMRIKFDQQMQEIESLHKLEQKAMRTAKRLAIENDRILDMLMDINDSPQIPFEKRIDISLEDEDENDFDTTQKPTKSLRKLEQDVPHRSYDATIEQFPEVMEDLDPKDPSIHPTTFLTGDDIDEYLYELDCRLKLPPKPTLAPSATGKEIHNPAANFALRNPTSVYNWLRRHAPKTFLQDLEKEKEKDKAKDRDDRHHDKDDDGGKQKRKSVGAARQTKRQSAASRKEKEVAESMDWDDDGYDAPAPKNKRKREEDGGYRPKGGSSRPSKKRKSKDLSSLPSKSARKSNA